MSEERKDELHHDHIHGGVDRQKSSGLYVCVAEPGEKGGQAKTQSVLVLKRNDPSKLLKGRESFREFAACPVIGGSDPAMNPYGD
jgi:hypothetical protein